MNGPWRRVRAGFVFMLAGLLGLLLWPIAVEVDADEPAEAPKLAVIVVFDQMRGDYLERWQELFGEGGFKRLRKDGAWFTNCHYPYASTFTAPGHASLVTGCSPDEHGVVANDWYDRAHAEVVTSVTPPPNEKRHGEGPYRRRQESVGDVLIKHKKARVVSLSIKDRVAILLAALRAQVCCWFDDKTGNFRTSYYYRDAVPPWVEQLNKKRTVDLWKGATWTRLRPELDYAKWGGPDDVAAEGTGYQQGNTFPHPFPKGGDPKADEAYYDAVVNSPMGNTLILALAKLAIEHEQLGQRDGTDLLCLGFSSNDAVGHCWGPDSQEVLDVTLRSDAVMRVLLDYLDAKVGKGRYVVALSADHGVGPLPELARAQGKDAGRIPPETLTTRAEAFLNRTFLKDGEKAPWLESRKTAAGIYLNRATLKELGLEPARVEKALAGWLTTQPGIQAAYTRTELMAKALPDDPVAEMVRRSFHPDVSGDVLAVLRPHYLLSDPLSPKKNTGYHTSHGTPHPYDTHVPLLVMGPGIRPGVRGERVTPQAMASILSRALGIPAPAGAGAPVPEGLFGR